jgi:hypothetical protein
MRGRAGALFKAAVLRALVKRREYIGLTGFILELGFLWESLGVADLTRVPVHVPMAEFYPIPWRQRSRQPRRLPAHRLSCGAGSFNLISTRQPSWRNWQTR